MFDAYEMSEAARMQCMCVCEASKRIPAEDLADVRENISWPECVFAQV